MGGFRDDREGLRAKVQALEGEVDELRRQLERAEAADLTALQEELAQTRSALDEATGRRARRERIARWTAAAAANLTARRVALGLFIVAVIGAAALRIHYGATGETNLFTEVFDAFGED